MDLLQLSKDLATNAQFLHEFSQKSVCWGVSVVPRSSCPVAIRLVRSSLIPRTFPKSLYQKIVDVNAIFNKLIDRIASDLDWLNESHHGTAFSDCCYYW